MNDAPFWPGTEALSDCKALHEWFLDSSNACGHTNTQHRDQSGYLERKLETADVNADQAHTAMVTTQQNSPLQGLPPSCRARPAPSPVGPSAAGPSKSYPFPPRFPRPERGTPAEPPTSPPRPAPGSRSALSTPWWDSVDDRHTVSMNGYERNRKGWLAGLCEIRSKSITFQVRLPEILSSS